MKLRLPPRGFNYQRLKLIDSEGRESKGKIGVGSRRSFPSILEWVVSCSIGTAITVAYFLWTGEFDIVWDWLSKR